MFSGIIESLGTVTRIDSNGTNKSFTIESRIWDQLKIDQSISHNGVCLTVEAIDTNEYTVTAVEETLKKTNLATWKVGQKVNLERCITLSSLLDGHLVQGHVDCIGQILHIENREGSFNLSMKFPRQFAHLIIEKGSIAINGISLTVFNVGETTCHVTIIPYTWEHTMLHTASEGDMVNLEFDVIGKYISRKLSLES